jgi:hypothetical protein
MPLTRLAQILSNSSATAGIPRVTKAPQTKSAEITLNTVKRARTQAPSVSAKPAEKKPQPSAKKVSKTADFECLRSRG